MLERKGAFEDAIVIVLSDHGESLGEPSPVADADGELPPVFGKPTIFGHGTHVFSAEQYRVLLGIRTFGETPIRAPAGDERSYPASLEDIAPTVLDALDIPVSHAFDGESLLPHLGNAGVVSHALDAGRIRFLETEFNPPGIAIEDRMSASAIARASASYRIEPDTDRVEIRREQIERIFKTRQYAATLNGHLLASVPAANFEDQHLVYVGPDNTAPVWLDTVPGIESAPVQQKLWQALRDRFEPVLARDVIRLPTLE
jgi:hypothetical protein